MEARAERTKTRQDWVLERLTALASSSMADFVEFGGEKGLTLKDISTLPDEVVQCIAEVAQNKDGTLRFKLYDKRAALVDIGRHLGMFTDNVALVDTTQEDALDKLKALDK